jgi:hypothetical protein
MAEPIDLSLGTTDAASATTQISYCPYLGLYHYSRADGQDYLFDAVQLEEALMAYLKQGDTRQAEFMTALTSLARECPHSIVELDSEMNYKILQLAPRVEEQPGTGDEPPKLSIVATTLSSGK